MLAQIRSILIWSWLAFCWWWLAFFAYTQTKEIYRTDRQGTDFEAALWDPAQKFLAGLSPYGPAADPSSYPPSAILSVLPVSWLPLAAASVVVQVVLAAAAFGTLWVLRVRDWRCYAIWFLTPPVLEGVLLGNTTLLVAFAVALVWRYRDSALNAGLAFAFAFASKLFVAPLAIWLLLTRRLVAAAIAISASVVVITFSWLVIGLDHVDDYRAAVSAATDAYQARGPLLHGFLRQIGLSQTEATVVGLLVAAALIALAWQYRADEIASFGLTAAASVAATPIAWNHYVTTLIVPLAVLRPRFSAVWALLAFFWFGWTHTGLGYGSLGRTISSLAACVGLVAIPLFWKRVVPAVSSRTALDPGFEG